MVWSDFLVPFLAIGLSELGDKTQLAVFTLSARHKEHWNVFIGVMIAFAAVDGMAILFGNKIMEIINFDLSRIIVSIAFVLFGLYTLASNDEEKIKEKKEKSIFLTSFSTIFLMEMGDKSQIASALFAASYNPILVFISVMSALAILSATAIFLGKRLGERMNHGKARKLSGWLFVAIGVLNLIR